MAPPQSTKKEQWKWISSNTEGCPGNFMPMGHHSRMNPVTQLHEAEMLGDCHQRESTHTKGEPKMWCQGRYGLWFAPANMVDQGGAIWRGWFVETKEVGWDHPSQGGCGPQVSPTLESHLQQLLNGEEPSSVGNNVEDGLPPHWHQHHPHQHCHAKIQSPPPAHLRVDRVACQVCADATLVGWAHKEPWPHRPQRICPEGAASFEVPNVCNWVKGRTTTMCSCQHTPPSESTIFCHPRMQGSEPRTSVLPSCNTPLSILGLCSIGLRGVPPVPGQPCHLVWSVQELWWTKEPLFTFTEDVFLIMVASKWMEITLPQLTKAISQESLRSRAWSSRACPRGSLSTMYSEGQPTTTAMQATAKAEVPTTPPQELIPHQSMSDHKPLCSPPRFMEITQSLWREEPMESNPMPVVTGVPS